jgi:hypothetical protein
MKASTVTLALLCTAAAFARLGETEAQSIARYGPQDNNLIKPGEQPLLPGARELAFSQPGWRIRAAFVGGVALAMEYQKTTEAEDGRQLSRQDIQAILEAEKSKGVWRAEVMGPKGRRVKIDEDKARQWERSDRATAHLRGHRLILLARDAEEQAAKAAKTAATTKASASPVPKPKF